MRRRAFAGGLASALAVAMALGLTFKVISSGSVAPAVWLTFAPDGGVGLVAAATSLCGLLTAEEKVGAWECLEGDGTSTAWDGGTGVFTEVRGNATTQSWQMCPNGPNCGSVTRQVMNVGSTLETTPVMSGSDSFTACVLAMRDGTVHPTSDAFLFSQAPNESVSDFSWYFYFGAPSGVTRFRVSSGVAAAEVTPRNELDQNMGFGLHQENLLCGTWSSANGVIAYQNGNASTPAALATRNNVSTRVVVNGLTGGGINTGDFRVRGAFVTRTELSATRIAELTKLALGAAITSVEGAPLVTSRLDTGGGGRSCAVDLDESVITMLAANIPCITRNGLEVWRNAGHEALRSEELDVSPWADVGTPTVTANAVLSPEGSLSADTLTDDSASVLEGRSQAVTTTAAIGHTFAVWLKGGTQTRATIKMTGTGNSAGDATCAITGISTTAWRRYACTSPAAYTGSVTAVTVSVLVGTSAWHLGTVHAWGADFQYSGGGVGAGTTSSPYVAPYSRVAADQPVTVPQDNVHFAINQPLSPSSMAVSVQRQQTAAQTNGRKYMAWKAQAGNADEEVHAESTYNSDSLLTCKDSVDSNHQQSILGLSGFDRVSCEFSETDIQACIAGGCDGGFQPTGPFIDGGTVFWLGRSERNTANWQPDGVMTNACLGELGACSSTTVAAIYASRSTGLTTTEPGGTTTMTFVLGTRPTANVVFTLTSSNTAEATVSPSSLTFTTANWYVPQTVTVTGVDDPYIDGLQSWTVTTGAASSADTAYNAMTVVDLTGTNDDSESTPLIEFAPLDGGSMGAACACAAPSANPGGALTTTRSTVATCLPASQTSATVGAMVRCGANYPRVTTLGVGSALKVLSEAAVTNTFSAIGHITEDFNSASWTKAGTVGVYADDAGAPDGTQTADGIQLAATSGGGFSSMYQSAVAATAPATTSVWVAGITPPDGGTAQSGTMDVCGYDSTSWTCSSCNYVPWPTWTRCAHTVSSGTPVSVHYGNLSIYNGGVARGAHSVAFWGAQMETNASATSYQPPDAGSRTVETHKFAALPDAMNTGCVAVSYVPQFNSYTGNWGPSVVHGAAAAFVYGEGNNVKMYDGVTALARSITQDGGAKRIRAWWSAVDGGMQICNDTDSSCSAVTAYDGTMPLGGGALLDFCSAVQIGTFAGKAACYDLLVDQDPTRCGP